MLICIRIFFSLMFLSLSFSGWTKPPERKDLTPYIKKNCPKNCVNPRSLLYALQRQEKKHRVDKRLMLAVIKVESSFNVKARGGSAVGLTQVMPRYHHKKFAGKNYYNVNDNVAVGTQVYKACQDKMRGNVRRSLKCYNGGGDRNYATKVLKAYAEIKQLGLTS